MSADALEIGLDGRNRFPAGGGTGVSTYVGTLAKAIRELGHRPRWLLAQAPDGNHRAISPTRRFFRALAPRGHVRSNAPGSDVCDANWVASDLYRTAHVHFGLYRHPMPLRATPMPTLMHWTYPLPLRLEKVPQVLTIHDLIPLECADLTGIDPTRHDRLLRRLLPHIDCVATVSNTVRRAVLARYEIPPERVVTTGQPVDLAPALLADARALVDPPVPRDAYLVVGTVETRKNVGRIIAAHGRSGSRRRLVIVGPDGDGAAAEMQAVASHPAPETVLRFPWLPRTALVRAMSDARAIVFPSLAEGFGLPIVEAMTLGVPVITSLGGATEEVAGAAALLVEPRETSTITDGIRQLDRDDSTHARLRDAGLTEAARFSPAAYALQIETLYRTVLERSSAGLPAIGRIS